MKIKLNGKELHPTDSVKYLGVKVRLSPSQKKLFASMIALQKW